MRNDLRIGVGERLEPVPRAADTVNDQSGRVARTQDFGKVELIGADEFDGVILDGVPPTVTFTPIAALCSSADRTLNATVTDNIGVPTTGTLIPRIYFKKNSGSYFSSAGIFTSREMHKQQFNQSP